MDFSLDPAIDALRLKVRAFVDGHVMPLESDAASYDAYGNIRLDLLAGLREKAKAQGLWAPHDPSIGHQGSVVATDRWILPSEVNTSPGVPSVAFRSLPSIHFRANAKLPTDFVTPIE